jgi:hypothetical protein
MDNTRQVLVDADAIYGSRRGDTAAVKETQPPIGPVRAKAHPASSRPAGEADEWATCDIRDLTTRPESFRAGSVGEAKLRADCRSFGIFPGRRARASSQSSAAAPKPALDAVAIFEARRGRKEPGQ